MSSHINKNRSSRFNYQPQNVESESRQLSNNRCEEIGTDKTTPADYQVRNYYLPIKGSSAETTRIRPSLKVNTGEVPGGIGRGLLSI